MPTRPLGSVLVRTKLTPPSQRDKVLERPRLVTGLLERVSRKLFLISAPAGYGKTTLLAQIQKHIEARNIPVAWLSLEEADNDFARFLSYLIAAIQSSGIAFGHATSALLTSGLSLPTEIISATLHNELLGLSKDIFIFVDDYHLITDPTIANAFRDILLAPLDRIHFVVATRTPKLLPISRLRTAGQLHEIDSFDLEFSEVETQAYFSASGDPLSPDKIAYLHQRTEGWIAALQLASLAIGNAEDPIELLDTLSGERRSIGEFLAEEVFRRQSADVRQFLMATSILTRFDAALCNAVTGRPDSQLMIERIGGANLFLFSLDDERKWFRYHHLFAEFLQRCLRDEGSENLAKLHLRASRALNDAGLVNDAIEHAFSAGDLRRAGELLDVASPHLFATGQTATLRTQAKRLPDELLRRLPLLQLELAWEAEIRWEFPSARMALENVRAVLYDDTESASQKRSSSALTHLRSKLAHREMMLSVFADQLTQAAQQARHWLAEYQVDEPFMQASVGTTLILCDRELHSCKIVQQTFSELHNRFLQAGAVYGTAFHGSLSGTAFFMRGELDVAERIYRNALSTAERLHGVGSPLAAMPAHLLAELLYERDQLNEVRDLLGLYPAGLPQLGFVDNLIASIIIPARMAVLEGNVNQALDILSSGQVTAERLGFLRLRTAVVCEQSRVLNLGGREHDIRQNLEEANFVLSEELCKEPISLEIDLLSSYARVTEGLSKEPSIEGLLRSIYNRAQRRHCTRIAVRAAVQLALVAWRRGTPRDARHYLGQVLKMSMESGFIRTALDEGEQFLALLRDYAGDENVETYALVRQARDLIEAAGRRENRTSAGAAAALYALPSEKLTTRELEVMRMGLDSRTNEESARLLGLTESTVKWYWQRIFHKLEVRRRSDAIRKARELNLL
jgi:LuxR family transcriptional regulator, maltose regulon positive regulatory protein